MYGYREPIDIMKHTAAMVKCSTHGNDKIIFRAGYRQYLFSRPFSSVSFYSESTFLINKLPIK